MLERGAVAGLNHLLSRQPLAAERLRPFAGKGVEVRCPPFPDLRVTIRESGLLDPAPAGTASALVVRLKAAALPLLLARDKAARSQIEIEGPADLAGAVDAVFSTLAWDIEEDLSTVFGDVLAHRLASGGRALAAWQRDALLRLAENFAEYWVEEQPLLLRPDDAQKFKREVDSLRDATARLEKRIERLESPGKR
jgi:ubiquinone biosynthesis protein UbiJ